ncbi:MAG: ABC transporter substrate-binding protein [Candidatus Taylorbacteria bacterium]|nr:ABC transporter substrate-binding protein [Candidatus Taylorbacteria bacterium]
MNMKPIVIIAVGIGIFIFSNNPHITNNKQINVGVILPMTGNMSAIGEDMKTGMELAFSNSPEFSVSYEDNMSDVKSEVSAYRKLQAVSVPSVIVSAGIGDMAVIPLAEEDKTPLILTVSSASGIPKMGEYIFRYFTNADIDAPVMARYATKELGLKNFAVLYLQDQFSLDYKNIFEKNIASNGGKIVASEGFQYTDFDFRTQLTKLQQHKFDSIYLIGLDYQLVTAIKQIKAMGIKAQIISVGTIATKDSIQKAGPDIDGTYVTAFCTDGAPNEYVKKYQEKYGRYPGFFSEFGYDIGQMIIAAGQNSNGNKETIKSNLLKIRDFPGNSGLISSDQYGEMAVPVCIKKITDGKIFNTATRKYSNY